MGDVLRSFELGAERAKRGEEEGKEEEAWGSDTPKNQDLKADLALFVCSEKEAVSHVGHVVLDSSRFQRAWCCVLLAAR